MQCFSNAKIKQWQLLAVHMDAGLFMILRHATRLGPQFSLYNVSSCVRDLLHGVSSKFLAVRTEP